MDYGYQESNELSNGSGKFGLNVGLVTKFEYNPNAGADGAAQDAIDFTVTIEGREYMGRFFPITKVFGKEGGEITDTNSQAYKTARNKAVAQLNATLSDIVKCYVTPEELKQALMTPIASFADFARILERLVKSNPSWETQEVDVFLQYQWAPKGENTRTFLELPKNVKHGTFITKHLPGTWTESKTDTHVEYVDQDGNKHPFRRGAWYVKSAFANPTIIGEDASSATQHTPIQGAGGAPANATQTW